MAPLSITRPAYCSPYRLNSSKRHCLFAYIHDLILNTFYTLIVITSSLDNSDTPRQLDQYIKRLCLRTDHLGLELLLPLYERPSRLSVAIG